MMDRWSHEVSSWSREQIQVAVNDNYWQTFRVSLKGLSTSEKLARLEQYLIDHADEHGVVSSRDQCRVDNYINALRRGGQLDLHNRIAR